MHGWVATRRQGQGSAWGPWAHTDVPEHEVTQLLLAAGGDFSSPCQAPKLSCCQQASCVQWLFHASSQRGQQEPRWETACSRRPSPRLRELRHPHASMACMTIASFLRALVPSRETQQHHRRMSWMAELGLALPNHVLPFPGWL